MQTLHRAMACVAVAALLALGQAGAQAQSQPPPADRAEQLWRQGHLLHSIGRYRQAVVLYSQSIALRPTAEGHTYRGWSLSYLGLIEEAIADCKKAIELDPDFGNPYNDIGAYLIALDRADEAIPWFEKAIAAPRYCCYQFAHFNLGRVFLGQGRVAEAKRQFELALEKDPDHLPAKKGLEDILKNWL